VSTSAIFASGNVAEVCAGAVAAGPDGFGCAQTALALIAAKKATAAIARKIFISVL
jgi:hypothetical protein